MSSLRRATLSVNIGDMAQYKFLFERFNLFLYLCGTLDKVEIVG